MCLTLNSGCVKNIASLNMLLFLSSLLRDAFAWMSRLNSVQSEWVNLILSAEILLNESPTDFQKVARVYAPEAPAAIKS